MTIDKLKAGAREWHNVKMIRHAWNTYAYSTTNFHPEALCKVVEYSALERALKILEIYEEALKYIKSSDTHGLKNAITYSNVAHEALEAARKVLDDKTN